MNGLTFQEKSIGVLYLETCRSHEKLYRTPAKEFARSVITLERGNRYEGPTERGVEIMLITEGRIEILDNSCSEVIEMDNGISVIVPAAVQRYSMRGEGAVSKAAVTPGARV